MLVPQRQTEWTALSLCSTHSGWAPKKLSLCLGVSWGPFYFLWGTSWHFIAFCCVPSLPTRRRKTSSWEVHRNPTTFFPSSLLSLGSSSSERHSPGDKTKTPSHRSGGKLVCRPTCMHACNYLTSTNIPYKLRNDLHLVKMNQMLIISQHILEIENTVVK